MAGMEMPVTIPKGAIYTEADVRFMQGMIAHHLQAVEMTELLSTRTASEGMKKLGLRIQVSQTDEIRMMEEWLQGFLAKSQRSSPHRHCSEPPRWSWKRICIQAR